VTGARLCGKIIHSRGHPCWRRLEPEVIGGPRHWAVGVPATLTNAVLVAPGGMAGLKGAHDLITTRRPLGDDVSVKLGAGKGFATNRTSAFENAFHTILNSKPRIWPSALAIRVTIILTF